MGRPPSKGMPYFPMDVDFLSDIKIRKIMRACGASSIAILLYLLGNIYRDEGYYMIWDEDVAFLIADNLGVSEALVSETIKKALQVNFFNDQMLQKYSILTSKGIQSRFFEATKKRSNPQVISEYIIVSDTKTRVTGAETLVKVAESTQSKVKESKVKDDDIDKLSKIVIAELNKLLKTKTEKSSSIKKIIKSYPADEWQVCLDEIKKSKYLQDNLEIAWLADADNFAKVISGYYRDRPKESAWEPMFDG